MKNIAEKKQYIKNLVKELEKKNEITSYRAAIIIKELYEELYKEKLED